VSELTRLAALRLLLINPNTSVHITERLTASAQRALAPGAELCAMTALKGPRAVRFANEIPAATRNVIEMASQFGPEHDAVLIGISLDCGLDEARRLCAPRPVIGMTEAACLMACLHGPRFGLLTLGGAMAPLYEAHVAKLGLAQRLVAVAAPDSALAFDAAGDSLSGDLLDQLTRAGITLMEQGADSIVLAGAVLCGYGPALERRLGLPVLDGVICAVKLACARLAPLADEVGSMLATPQLNSAK